MKTRLLRDGEERTWAVIFEVDDEVIAGLTRFAQDQDLRAAHFSAIGAFREATLRYFDWETKEYQDIPVREQVEVLSLSGNVAETEGGEKKAHVHVVLGKRDGTTLGGHLKEALVRPTLEVVVTEEPSHLVRRHDETTGLALIDP